MLVLQTPRRQIFHCTEDLGICLVFWGLSTIALPNLLLNFEFSCGGFYLRLSQHIAAIRAETPTGHRGEEISLGRTLVVGEVSHEGMLVAGQNRLGALHDCETANCAPHQHVSPLLSVLHTAWVGFQWLQHLRLLWSHPRLAAYVRLLHYASTRAHVVGAVQVAVVVTHIFGL